jgi:hypothetical protein
LDPAERRQVLERITASLGLSADLEQWMEVSPLVEVVLLAS